MINAWELRLREGPAAGAWKWQVFHLAPWESSESQYQGAAFMALAVGMAPDGYQKQPTIQPNLELLKAYLGREFAQQPLLDQTVLLWASSKLPGVMPPAKRDSVITKLLAKQEQDGGWRVASLGSWERQDHSTLNAASDGYPTGLVTLALEESGMLSTRASVEKGIAWLSTHQDQAEGPWHASSLNKKRDPATDIGKFMSDAATGYAVLALETAVLAYRKVIERYPASVLDALPRH